MSEENRGHETRDLSIPLILGFFAVLRSTMLNHVEPTGAQV